MGDVVSFLKRCSSCEEEQPRSAFVITARGREGSLAVKCVGCRAKAAANETERRRSVRQHPTRAKTIPVKLGGLREVRRLRLLPAIEGFERPHTRGDCVDGIRPCPYVSCSHHLYLDVNDIGNLHVNFPDLEPDQLEKSCALDVADEGGATLEDVGRFMNVTRERVRQIELSAVTR
jgi:hypothetical protein